MQKQEIDIEIKNINDEIEKNTTIHEKIAIAFSKKIGSMKFIYSLFIFMALWTSINIILLLSNKHPFDKPYEFSILLLVSNTIQLITPLFILISQNIQDKRDKALADQEYFVAKRTEEETKLIISKLDDISNEFKNILVRIQTQQNKLISLEEKQETFNESVFKSIFTMLQTYSAQINERPCLLKSLKKEEIVNALIKALEDKKVLEKTDN